MVPAALQLRPSGLVLVYTSQAWSGSVASRHSSYAIRNVPFGSGVRMDMPGRARLSAG